MMRCMTVPWKCSSPACSKSERSGERNVGWMPKQNEADNAPWLALRALSAELSRTNMHRVPKGSSG